MWEQKEGMIVLSVSSSADSALGLSVFRSLGLELYSWKAWHSVITFVEFWSKLPLKLVLTTLVKRKIKLN